MCVSPPIKGTDGGVHVESYKHLTEAYDSYSLFKQVNGEGSEVTNKKLEDKVNNCVAIGDEVRETPNLLKHFLIDLHVD